MMKSRLFLLLWMCCSVLLTACENDEPTPQPPVEGSRTVLAYLASDNSLSSFALADLEEMRLGMEKVSANNVHLSGIYRFQFFTASHRAEKMKVENWWKIRKDIRKP